MKDGTRAILNVFELSLQVFVIPFESGRGRRWFLRVDPPAKD